ncbi:hypothetical protein AGR7B_Lc110115 [Agrobacterium deltaense RV3]|nr:hypothetical protein AGR7B_Lc110115 [Agrobacterium deltaense RV3]
MREFIYTEQSPESRGPAPYGETILLRDKPLLKG